VIPRAVQNDEFGPTRKLSRFNCFSEGSIELIEPSEKQLNPEALARSKFTILNRAGYNLGEKMLKKYLPKQLEKLVFAFSITQSCLILANEESSELQCCQPTIIAMEPLDPCVIASGYPYPATISPCNSWDFYVKASLMYLAVGSDPNAFTAQRTSFDGLKTKNLFQKTAYLPAFDVSVGFDLESVVFEANYFRYHQHNTSHFSAGNGSAILLTGAAPGSFASPHVVFQSVRAKSTFNIDRFIVSLQKPAYFGNRIIINLGYGLRTLWVQQKYDLICAGFPFPPPNGDPTSNGFTKTDHKSWATGPDLLLRAKALLPWHLRALVDLDLAIMVGTLYKGFQTTSYPNAPAIVNNTTVKIDRKPHFIQAFSGGQIGLGWGSYFACDQYHIDFTLNYTFEYNHMFIFGFPFLPPAVANLTQAPWLMHGFVIGGRLDF